MRLRVVFSLVLASLLCSTAAATPKLWDIYSTSDQPFVNVTIDRYESDSLYVRSGFQAIAIHQDSIKYIVQKNEPRTGAGLLIGAAAGGAVASSIPAPTGLAALFAGPSVFTLRVLCVVVGAVLGGAVGSGAGADMKYRLDDLDPKGKRALLNQLFSRRDGRR